MRKIFYIFILFLTLFFCNKVYAYQYYSIGDQVTYNGDSYHVIDYSDEDKSYVALLKDNFLTSKEIDKYKKDISEDSRIRVGELPYYNDNNEFVTDYNDSKIKKVVDYWSNNEFGSNLVELNGYKARLLNADDISYLGFSGSESCGQTTTSYIYIANEGVSWTASNYYCENNDCYYTYTFDGVDYKSCSANATFQNNGNMQICDENGNARSLLDFVTVSKFIETCSYTRLNYSNLITSNSYPWMNGTPYWTMLVFSKNYSDGDISYKPYYYVNNTFYTGSYSDISFAIRPVVNVKKTLFGGNKNYNIGDEIIYNNQKYNVIYETNSDDEYVTLLKKEPFTNIDIDKALNVSRDGLYEFYYDSVGCKYNPDYDPTDSSTYTGGLCTNDYMSSFIKEIIDAWYNDNVPVSYQYKENNLNTRLLTIDELINKFGYTLIHGSVDYISATEDTPEWVYDPSYSYWLMDNINDNNAGASVVSKFVDVLKVYDSSRIRPVIYLSKCALGDLECSNLVCREGTTAVKKNKKIYKKYKNGDILTLNNEKYIVLKDSSEKAKNLTLFKIDSLTLEDIRKYYNPDAQDNKVPFYISDTCNSNDNSLNCNNKYTASIVKTIIDKWANDNFDDNFLNEYKKYKARLITTDELIATFYLRYITPSGSDAINYYGISEDTPDIFKNSNISTWTMSSEEKNVYYYSNGLYYKKSFNNESINPVINVNKCALEDGCYEEEVIVGCMDENGNIIPLEPEEDVEVASTLSTVSKIAILVSFFLIIGGIILISYTYRHKLLERKTIKK